MTCLVQVGLASYIPVARHELSAQHALLAKECNYVHVVQVTVSKNGCRDCQWQCTGCTASHTGDFFGGVLWGTCYYFCSPVQLLLIFIGRVEAERPSDKVGNLLLLLPLLLLRGWYLASCFSHWIPQGPFQSTTRAPSPLRGVQCTGTGGCANGQLFMPSWLGKYH